MVSFVTGANGHLGNNVVRYLHSQHELVVAGVRDLQNARPFEGLECERRYADLLNPQSLRKAFRGIDTLYQVGAVFQRWSRHPDRDIIQPNLAGTRHVLEAAAHAGVTKVVYVSSTSALNPDGPFDGTTWNPMGPENPYTYSKTEAEKLAHHLARELGLDVSFVLPTAIIGPNFYQLTPTLELFASVYQKQLPFAPRFTFMMVDGRDVAMACSRVARQGKPGERYVISGENPVSVRTLFEQVQQQFPQMGFKIPGPPPKALFFTLARLAEFRSRFSGKPPLITLADAREFWDIHPSVDLSKSRQDLGFVPRSMHQSVADTFTCLRERYLTR